MAGSTIVALRPPGPVPQFERPTTGGTKTEK
jgi:hypothetical protein